MNKLDKKMAEQFAEAVCYFTRRHYCVGAASEDEFRFATAAWVEGWLRLQYQQITPGTICPSPR